MAVEKGDWVAVNQFTEGEVVEVRGDRVTIDNPAWHKAASKLTVPIGKVRITTRPQTGLRGGRK